MTTVFLSGSRAISRINDEIRQRIDNIVEKDFNIVVGDANGADKAMQSYLAEISYPHVTVYYVGEKSRNNVGDWQSENVAVSGNLTGRDFYTVKDKEMARRADFGLVLWDGKSSGSVANVLEMLRFSKKVVVYFAPEKMFHTVSSEADARQLIAKCDADAISEIRRKVELTGTLRDISQNRQSSLVL
jgi:hypothetical protein